MDDRGARGVAAFLQGIDQQVVHAALLQGGGERQAGGAGADDQDIDLSG